MRERERERVEGVREGVREFVCARARTRSSRRDRISGIVCVVYSIIERPCVKYAQVVFGLGDGISGSGLLSLLSPCIYLRMVVRAPGERLVNGIERLVNGIERSAFAPEISVFVMERAVMRLCVQSPTPSALWNSSASVRVSRSVAHASARVCARVRA